MNRIKELRKKADISIDQLSLELKEKGINISASAISKYEREQRKPKPETWRALADYFDVSVPYLRGATTYEILDLNEKGIYGYVTEAMDRAFNDYAFLPETKERVLKAIAYSIDDGEFN
ncbi:helix-turn-helix domain-containing protein [Lactobacillus johnsonii]|uniref:helix-turn-helix domain-containing protein n=1 Tax=Lactobacillus johnsonii TaxID=33959 RepID=UPI003647368E